MRLLLVLVLLNGLVPGLSEVGETVVHYARTGHVAHTAADHGDLGHQGDEHGCGTTSHRCPCCASQPLVAPADVAVAVVAAERERPRAPGAVKLPARELARPFRPPIG